MFKQLPPARTAAPELPTLEELEPVANFLAARFAQASVSMNKVQDIAGVLTYHCVRRRGADLQIEFGLLGAWLTRARKIFVRKKNQIEIQEDVEGFSVLCAVLSQFADRYDALKSESERRALHRLLMDWLAVLIWKFKTLADKDKTLLSQAKPHAARVAATTQKVAELAAMPRQDSLAARCRAITEQLRQDTAELPYVARFAVGMK